MDVMYTQALTPNPDIPCRPGWCLQYVREAFGLPGVHPTATAAWEASGTRHTGRDVPAGVWVPIWYELDNEPAGHVALHTPDGSVYSTSDLGTVPHHHPDIADLEAYYARYGMPLTWRGWTEDIEGATVITPATINPASTPPTGSDDMFTDEDRTNLAKTIKSLDTLTEMVNNIAGWMNTNGTETQVNVQRIRTDQVAGN